MSAATVRDQAIAWFDTALSGEMTAEDMDALNAWLAASPDARAAYEALEDDWIIAGHLRDDPEVRASRDANRAIYGGTWRRWVTLRRAMAIAAVLLLALLPLLLVPRTGARPIETFSTGPSRHITTTLADGSVVTLDANTELHVMEMGARRRIELASGHAFFQVAKDPRHPFLVTAADKTVHALGTAFDVRITGATVAVTLIEGKVRVDRPRRFLAAPVAAEMVPGQQLVTDADDGWRMYRADPDRAVAWTGGQAVYLPDTLGRIIADVNRTSAQQIVLTGNYDPNRKIVGIFRTGDTGAVIDALELNGIARVTRRDRFRIEMTAEARR